MYKYRSSLVLQRSSVHPGPNLDFEMLTTNQKPNIMDLTYFFTTNWFRLHDASCFFVEFHHSTSVSPVSPTTALAKPRDHVEHSPLHTGERCTCPCQRPRNARSCAQRCPASWWKSWSLNYYYRNSVVFTIVDNFLTSSKNLSSICSSRFKCQFFFSYRC